MADEGLGEVGAQPPIELGKSLRCCVPCRLVKTFEQFYEQARRCLLSSDSVGCRISICGSSAPEAANQLLTAASAAM